MNTASRILVWLMLLAGCLFTVPDARAQQANTLVVGPDGGYPDIPAALRDAQTGDVIEVRGGTHAGPLVIDKSITLRGVDWPIIDGGGHGTVLKLSAPGIQLEGFLVRNSGAVLDEENSGIAGEAPNLTISENRLEDILFGIYLREAHNSVVSGNQITSKPLDVPRRGDPIRVWYSNFVRIENNEVYRGRDVVLWYSENLTVTNNRISDGRYGLHFMYCDDAWIEGNWLDHNSVGAFLMYSRRMNMHLNTIANNRGPSGYGIGLKDMDDAVVEENLFLNNRIGAHLDNSPREVDSTGLFRGNIFAFNDIGIHLMPATRHNQFTANSFLENQEQVAIAGGGQLAETSWSVAGVGNFWSDYAGYDQAEDGFGDQPYQSDKLFENLTDRYPDLHLFVYSPSALAIEFAARAVPLFKPAPKLVDEAPLMEPIIPDGLPAVPSPGRGWLGWASGGLILVAGLIYLLPSAIERRKLMSGSWTALGGKPVIEIQELHKHFGPIVAVDRLSADIQPGECIALWGPNGAGKTTVLRSILGVIPFEGRLSVAGFDPRTQGKEVRRQIGFVPQELNFHDDLTVIETIRFYAALKKVNATEVNPDGERVMKTDLLEILSRLNLEKSMAKTVAELSGGMKQRLALAISLLSDPPVLLLDEPTSNLDVNGRDDFLDLLMELKAEGKTLIFSSHRFEEVIRLANRVLVLDAGRLVADLPPERIHEYGGWNVFLRLSVGAGSVQQARGILEQAGYRTRLNGKGIWIEVDPRHKGMPFESLVKAGIPVADFEIAHANKERENA